MSLVPHYVKLDGIWFKNLIIHSSNGDWFLCFDDNEPPEVVTKQSSIMWADRRSGFELRDFILKRLTTAGILAVATSNVRRCGRVFSEGEKFHPALSFYVDLKGFHPNHLTYMEHKGFLEPNQEKPEGVYISPNERETWTP